MSNKEIEKIIKRVQTDSDKKMQKYMKTLSEDFKKQIGVYSEQVDDRFKAAGEGIDSINEKLEKMQGDIDNITLEVRDAKLKVHDISYKL